MNILSIDKLSKRVNERNPLIQVLLGPRQVGKTTAARHIYDSFGGSKIFESADSPIPPSADWIETHWLRARALPEPTLLIIDEVQKVTDWSEVVKRLFDADRGKRDIRVVLLGSASLSLQQGLRESLAGRFELIRAYHWNLSDCHKEFGWNLDTFLKFGGYPAAAKFIADKDRWRNYIRDSIIETVIGRDISSLTTITKPALFRQTFELAMHYPAQELSYQKIVGQLQERGSAQTVKHYLEIMEGAFLLKQVFKYSKRPLSTRESSPKILPLAPALIHAVTDPDRLDVDPQWRGRVFEAVVGAALARDRGELYAWRERAFEVDYVLRANDTLYAIEVKSGRMRGVSGLMEFSRRYPAAKSVMVTYENCTKLLSGEDVNSALGELVVR